MRRAIGMPPQTADTRYRAIKFSSKFALLILFLVLFGMPAYGHDVGVSSSDISVDGLVVAVEIHALALDYEKAAGVRISEGGSGQVNPVALAVMAPAVLRYVRAHVGVFSDGVPCVPDEGKALPADTHVAVALTWTCRSGKALRYRLSLFQDVNPSAQHLVSLKIKGGSKQQFALDRNTPELSLSGEVPSNLQVAEHFLAAGIEHIFLGYDHIAFLIAIILWTSRKAAAGRLPKASSKVAWLTIRRLRRNTTRRRILCIRRYGLCWATTSSSEEVILRLSGCGSTFHILTK